MIVALSLILSLLALALAGLSLFVFAEVGLASRVLRKHNQQDASAILAEDAKSLGPITIIVPAHNEGDFIRPTLGNAKAQLRPQDRLLVVADNCSDDTADIARAAGADVIERSDTTKRGKGYALQFAIDHLVAQNPDTAPAFICILDADCLFTPKALQITTAAAAQSTRPAQALYMMRAPEGASPKQKMAAFAWALMNKARMAGLYHIADVTRLTGSGMVLPWSIAKTLNVASGEIVEDLALTITLTQKDKAPILVAQAEVYSTFPSEERAAAKQHARWEHGALRLAQRKAFGLAADGLIARSAQKFALALDIAIPPLVMFGALIVALSGAALIFGAVTQIWLPLSLCLLARCSAWRDDRARLEPCGARYFACARLARRAYLCAG